MSDLLLERSKNLLKPEEYKILFAEIKPPKLLILSLVLSIIICTCWVVIVVFV